MQFAAKLLHSVARRKTDDVHLVGVQHFDLNDTEVRSEFERIAPQLQPALTRDIADSGNAFAEVIDRQHRSDSARQVMTLLLTSSLSRAVGGRIGLTENEIIEFLVAPSRRTNEFKDAVGKLQEQAWFLHREEHRFYVKETENLGKQIERTAKSIPQPKIDQAFINRITDLLEPIERQAYQSVHVNPKLKNVQMTGSRILIVIRPDGKIPPNEIQNYFSYIHQKNNLLVLTGGDSHLAVAVEDRLRILYAAEQILANLKNGDSLYEEALERVNQAEDLFYKAVSASYNQLYYPGIEETDKSERLLSVTIDQGLKIGKGEHSAEAQIVNILGGPRANAKLATDFKNSPSTYIAMAEEIFWPAGKDNRRIRWSDVVNLSKSIPSWPWIPGARGIENLKSEALNRGKWRVVDDFHIEKGPFPKDKATVNITPLGTDELTKETILSLTPRFAGEAPRIHYSTNQNVSPVDPSVQNFENFRTTEGTIYFLVVDPAGKFESADSVRWTANIKIQHKVESHSDKRNIVIQCIPPAKVTYTIDSTSPRKGIKYSKPFEIGNEAIRLSVYAQAGEATKEASFLIPASGKKQLTILDHKCAELRNNVEVLLSSTEQVYEVINRFKSESDTLFRGVRIEIGDSDKTITLRMTKNAVSAATMEDLISFLRNTLLMGHSPISVKIYDGIKFHNGIGLKDFARISGVTLLQSHINQDS